MRHTRNCSVAPAAYGQRYEFPIVRKEQRMFARADQILCPEPTVSKSIIPYNLLRELMVHPAAKKRGADAHVPPRKRPEDKNSAEEKLEQGLEESMAGSDPVSITQPTGPGRDAKSDKH
jgi:hypothetical protein